MLSFRLLSQFARTGNFKDLNVNMIEAEASEEYSPENKGNDEIMRDKDLVQKS